MIDLYLKDYTNKIESTINYFFTGCSKLRKKVKKFLDRENSWQSPMTVSSLQSAVGKEPFFFINQSFIHPSLPSGFWCKNIFTILRHKYQLILLT